MASAPRMRSAEPRGWGQECLLFAAGADAAPHTKKKESSIFMNRTSQHAAKVIDPFFRLAQGIAVREPVVCIQLVVAQKLIKRSVEGIFPRPGGYCDLRARCAAKLRCVGGCLNPELLQGILGDQTVRAACYAKTGD